MILYDDFGCALARAVVAVFRSGVRPHGATSASVLDVQGANDEGQTPFQRTRDRRCRPRSRCPPTTATAVAPGIVHLGVGAFHRAHQAAYVDDCLAAGETGWGIVGASLQSARHARCAGAAGRALHAGRARQRRREACASSARSCRCWSRRRIPAALLDALTDPRIRIVTLTITEKAYLRNAAGDLDAAHPGIVADLATPDKPQTAHGFLVEALARRRAAGTPPFTILCCDNLPANGATLHRLLVQFAALRDPALARHIAEDVACPSSMVDRIVPATTDADRARVSAALGVEDAWPVMTEPFRQWVIEDNFPAGRPAWEKFGVTMVRDVRPFEEMKLACSTARIRRSPISACSAAMRPWPRPSPTRRSAASSMGCGPRRSRPCRRMPASIRRPTSAELAERFANTALAHRTAQIANDGSQKLPQRIVGSALDRLAGRRLRRPSDADRRRLDPRRRGARRHLAGRPFHRSARWPACPRLPPPICPPREMVARGLRHCRLRQGDSPHREQLKALASAHLETLRESGVAAALSALASGESPT